MLSQAENELLTRVEGNAPMGQMFRRYWLPMVLSEEIEPDGAPAAIRVLGQELVAFRDTQGRVGVLNAGCPHRLSSLVLGRNE
jgi:phthalate 4,5-dioxygenase oxygenase subunit